ncbi:MAG: hypothetical protein ACXWQ5_00080 [Ktedonobacterales bacterium]
MAKRAIVTISGSMRFFESMLVFADYETQNGKIVLMPFVKKASVPGEEAAQALDLLHLDKIAMSDEFLVVNGDRAGQDYIGQSTELEINYARELGIPIIFTEQHDCEPGCPCHGYFKQYYAYDEKGYVPPYAK